ncbi:MAG: hypothetical protein ACK5X3_19605 [Pseudomonadota bacterium]
MRNEKRSTHPWSLARNSGRTKALTIQFLDQCCAVTGSAGDSISSRELMDAFSFWLAERGLYQFPYRLIVIRLLDRQRLQKSLVRGKSFAFRKERHGGRLIGIRFAEPFSASWQEAGGRKGGAA